MTSQDVIYEAIYRFADACAPAALLPQGPAWVGVLVT
jgi:hypothetical protein